MVKEQNINNKEMIDNILNSTNSAILALSQMEQNLIRGRFKEGASSYDAMCKTLVGQRIWSSDKENDKVNENFRKISKSAQNIINMLSPYVNSLEKLTNIEAGIVFGDGDNIEEVPSISEEDSNTQNEQLDDKTIVYKIINESTKKQISYTKLRTKLGWDRKRLDTVLDSLSNVDNSISISTSGSRKIIVAN